ncbi:hypothetical protein GCM10009117_13390 [Gangjinia marincola]|uniref:Uncharacterized protein n=1 Tax=Gangjinia marincola TaxID=578463 RepID=A0ABN1MGG5_9FLAO
MIRVDVQAQDLSPEAISGSYSFPSTSPEGGAHLSIFEDTSFILTYFGGYVKGIYRISSQRINFIPDVAKQSLVVYGRKTIPLNDSVRFTYSNIDDMRLYVGLLSKDYLEMTPIFNKSPNCFSYPYKDMKTSIPKKIHFYLNSDYTRKKEILYTLVVANEENDFIVSTISSQRTDVSPFMGSFKEDQLSIDGNQPMKRRPFENKNDEDYLYLKYLAQKKLISDTVYYTHDPKEERFYTKEQVTSTPYDITKDHYRYPMYNRDTRDLTDTIIVHPLYRMKLTEIRKIPKRLTLREEPLFKVTCDY